MTTHTDQLAACREAISQRDRDIWRAAITLANNICVQQSNEHNADDETSECNATSYCANRVRQWLEPTDDDLHMLFEEAGVVSTPPKPGEDAVRLDYLENKLFFVDLPDDREADEIQLHIRVGNINDRTVVLAGEGKTLRDAIDAAMALTTTQQAGEPKV